MAMDATTDADRADAAAAHDMGDDLIAGFDAEVGMLERRIAQRIARRGHRPGATVLYGASSVRLWDDFVERFNAHHVARVGFGGATVPALDQHFARLVQPLHPGRLLLWPGSNDIGNFGATAEQVTDRIMSLFATVRRVCPNLPITYISVFVPPGRLNLRAEIEGANSRVGKAIHAIPGIDYMDVSASLIGDNGAPLGHAFATDLIHLNAEGYDRIEAHFMASLFR